MAMTIMTMAIIAANRNEKSLVEPFWSHHGAKKIECEQQDVICALHNW